MEQAGHRGRPGRLSDPFVVAPSGTGLAGEARGPITRPRRSTAGLSERVEGASARKGTYMTERIHSIGDVHGGKWWKLRGTKAIAGLEDGTYRFVVERPAGTTLERRASSPSLVRRPRASGIPSCCCRPPNPETG